MDREGIFFKQAQLMLRVMPLVGRETCFALKGGTAINFFLRDMPRLSVDIDLTYIPIESRDESLRKLSEAMSRIAAAIRKSLGGIKVQERRASEGERVTKLFINDGNAQIKVEPNEILRGSVYPAQERSVTEAVETAFEMSATMQVLSLADLYAGKLCAALDRQHPRDIFDVKLLLENEGITSEVRKAFVVYLAGHDRPIHELLNPKLKDLREVYDREFVGMTAQSVSCDDLADVRIQYIAIIRSGLTAEERRFLLSIKKRSPEWSLLDLPGIEKLPAIQWKILNLSKMKPEKHSEYVEKLKQVLEL